MFLASQSGEFLMIAVIAIFIIVIGLLIYYIITGIKQKKDKKVVQKPVVDEKTIQKPHEEEIIIDEETKEQKIEEEKKTNSSIQTLLNQMQQDLDESKDYSAETIARYEDDEEANAIISYKELMKYKESQEKNNTQEEKDILLEEKDKDEIKEIIKENRDEPKEEVKKFKRSEFISPIFGYNDDSNVTYREIKRPPKKEKIPDIDKEWESDIMLKNLEDSNAEVIDFDDQVEVQNDKNDEFLEALVDFRNKLN